MGYTTVNVDGMASAVMGIMTEYRDLAASGVKKAVKKAGRTVRDQIQTTAPRRTGRYAESWVAQTTSESSTGAEVTVKTPTRGMLTHLLENGHAKRGGGGRVPAYPHIGPAEEIGEAQLMKDIRKALKG